MSTLRISNIEAKSVPASATIDEKVKITNSSGDTLVFIDGKTSGITTVGINTTDSNITFDANSNIVVTGIITATRFSGQITPTSLEIGSNIKLGNAGVITATSFVGSGANLTNLPSQLTLSNNADNRVITGGSGTNLNGESNLQFNGTSLQINNTNASTQYAESRDLVLGNTSGSHGMTIISQSNNVGRIMWSDTYTAGTGTYEGQILYNHAANTLNFYSNYTNNGNVAMQLGGSNNELFVGIDGSSTTTHNNRSAFFHRNGGNYVSITTDSNDGCGIVFGDSIGNNTGNYETYIMHQNSTNDLWFRANQGSDNRHIKLKSTGNVEIGNGNLVMASGHGIDFSAASGSGAGSDSALLDDYEEGSWNPIWSDATSGGTTTSNNMFGRYTKVGKLVTAHFFTWGLPVQGTNNAMFLQGLPFASGSIGASYHTIGCAYFNMGADNYYNLGLRLANNVTYAPLNFCRKSNGDMTPALFNGFINYYTNFTGTITYLTA